MRVRRHRSFRPTLDVLPGRIAPSSGSGAPAAVAPSTAAPQPSTYDVLISNSNNSLASQYPPMDPP